MVNENEMADEEINQRESCDRVSRGSLRVA